VAASEVGLMIAEYFALSRLLHAVTHRPLRPILWVLAGVLVLSGPAGLLAPEFFAEGLLRPSLVALWLSQLAVFVAYPRFIARRRRLRADDWVLTAVAGAVSLFGLYAAITGHVVS
jgi:hypothetical protein